MPRPKSLKPAYCHHKASGRAFVRLDGKRIYLGKYNTQESRDAYDRAIGEWISQGRQLPPTPTPVDSEAPGRLTVSTVISRFWKHAQAYYVKPDGTPSGELENYRYALRPLRRLYGPTAAESFGPLALKAVRAAMIEPRVVLDSKNTSPADPGATRTEPGWCRKLANRQTNRIRHVFKWAVGEELLPASVHQALLTVTPLVKGRTAARESLPVKPVRDDQVEPILAHLSPQVRAIVELQALTGARGGELFPLRTCDLDMSQTAAADRAACPECKPDQPCPKHRNWSYRPAQHKTAYLDHVREIRFGPRAQAILLPFLKPDLQAFIFSPAEAETARHEARAKARKTPLSCGNKPGSNRSAKPKRKPGTTYNKNSYGLAIKMACRRAFPPPEQLGRGRVKGGKGTRWETEREWVGRLGTERAAELKAWRKAHHWHPHQLRHAVATRVRRDHGLEAAQVMLGQRSITVAQAYAEKNAELADEVVGKIG